MESQRFRQDSLTHSNMKKTLIILSTLCTFQGTAQLVHNGDYRSMGMGAGYMYSIDDATLNTNPSMLGWQSSTFAHRFSINFEDQYFKSASPLADHVLSETFGNFDISADDGGLYLRHLNVVFEAFDSYDGGEYTTYDTLVSRDSRAGFKDALEKNNTFKWRNTIVGATYVSKNYGTFSFNVSKETTFRSNISSSFADLLSFGKTASYFDTLVLIDGTHVANEEANYQNDILSQAFFAFSNDSMTFQDLIDGSNFEFIQTRNHSFGWGNEVATKKENVRLFVGGNLNLIEGITYFDLDATHGGFSIASFSKVDLPRAPYKNAGFGASFSASGTLLLGEKWMFSTGVNNLGLMRWRDGRYSEPGQNSTFEHYMYGVSDTKYFNQQIDESNFYSNFEPDGSDSTVFVSTPSNTYVGIRRNFGKVFSAGLDLITPMDKSAPGSMDHAFIGVNYQLAFTKFTFFGGFNNGDNGQAAMPIGLSFGSHRSKWEFGLSVSDLLGYFSKDKTNNISAGFGLKYRIL